MAVWGTSEIVFGTPKGRPTFWDHYGRLLGGGDGGRGSTGGGGGGGGRGVGLLAL